MTRAPRRSGALRAAEASTAGAPAPTTLETMEDGASQHDGLSRPPEQVVTEGSLLIAGDMSPLSPSAALAALDAALRASDRPPLAPNTERAYRADWADFAAWCDQHGLAALPAEPLTVRRYLVALMQAGRKTATIQRRLAALADAHARARLPSPTEDPAVRHEMQAIRRALGVAQRGKDPILVDELRAMVATLPEDLQGRRDRALLLLGFAGAFRRSELVGLAVEDLRFTRVGAVVTLRRSKTDQVGAGREVAIPKGSTPATCPVRAVQAWLRAAGIAGGPIYRRLDREGRVLSQAVSDRYVAVLVKRAAAAAGLGLAGDAETDGADPAGAMAGGTADGVEAPRVVAAQRYAGHSLRAGLVTSAALPGANEAEIAETTGHKSRDMVPRYTRKAEPFRRGVSGKVGR